MHTDVLDIRSFYKSPLGQTTAHLLSQALQSLWPNTQNMTVTGLGYALPYLSPFIKESQRVFALMPQTLGAIQWPENKPSLVTLCTPHTLPLPDQSIDRFLIIHGLEYIDHAPEFLREVWRVLKSEGHMICVTPNRLGLWARREITPFAAGSPYSQHQLETLLRESMFDPIRTKKCLFIPPTHSRTILATANTWEQLSASLFKSISGVIMVEAVKKVYGYTPVSGNTQTVKIRPIPTSFGS